MKSKSKLNLEIADFLQYIPEPKRRDYEMILLRCNFSDPADPLFPILLFLLFLERNLSGQSHTLAGEFRKLRNALETGQPLPLRRSRPWWRITMLTLLAFQVVSGIFALYKITGIDFQHSALTTAHTLPVGTSEIHKINYYWDHKLKNATKEKITMNSQELSPGDFIGVIVAITMIFIVLMAAQIILMLVAMSRLHKNDDELNELEEFIRHNLRDSSYHDEIGNYLDRFPEPVEPSAREEQEQTREPLNHDDGGCQEDDEEDLFNLK